VRGKRAIDTNRMEIASLHVLGKRIAAFFSRVRPARVIALWRVLRPMEKIIFLACFGIACVGIVWLGIHAYETNTTIIPARGGVFSEGLVQQPQSINPVITNGNETDALLEALIFSGLLKPDGQGGVMPDLAQSFEMKNDGTVYVATLRDNIVWHDNQPLTAQDILFTIDMMKSPALQHPLANFWNSITVQALSDKTIAFTLAKPYVFFPQYLTFKIIPKHVWENVPVNQFLLSELNSKPIGSGPYQFKKLTLDSTNATKQYTLVRFPRYYGSGPYIDTIAIKFYPDTAAAENALRKKEIASFANIPWDDIRAIEQTQRIITLQKPVVPTTIALFMNMNADILKDVLFRKALAYAIDNNAIVQDVFHSYAVPLDAPALVASSTQYIFNPTQSQIFLNALGWKDTNNNRIRDKKMSSRAKTPTELDISLIYLDTPDMQAIAGHIVKNLHDIGVNVALTALQKNEFMNRIDNKSFELILASETTLTGSVPDIYPFWHSSQQAILGLNISQYTNKEIDRIVTDIRKANDPERINILLDGFANRIRADVPAAFLVRPQWTWAIENYIHMPDILFINTPAQRFARANEWYIYTKRIWNN